MSNLVFIGNTKVTNTVAVAGITAIVLGNEYIPTPETEEKDFVAAVYKVTSGELNFKVAVKTPFTEETVKQFAPESLSEAEGKRRIVQVIKLDKSAIAKFQAEATKTLAQRKADLDAKEKADAEAEQKAREEANRKAKEEKEEQARRDRLAKELKAKKLDAALQAKAELESILETIAIGTPVYNYKGDVKGKVESLVYDKFGYNVKTEKGIKFLYVYDIVTEDAMVEATFDNKEPVKPISRQNFKKKLEVLQAAAGIDTDHVVFAKTAASEYKPEFDFSNDKLYGADRDSDGSWKPFAKDNLEDK